MAQQLPSLEDFAGRRVLLLQGPVGPFFRRLAQDLREAGASVHKLNFNGGDRRFFSPADGEVTDYTGRLEEWPAFLEAFVREKEIDAIFLYGDCRPVHDVAFSLFADDDVDIYTFEEGYIRPFYVTLERGRVNGGSSLPRDPEWYRRLSLQAERRSGKADSGHSTSGRKDPNTFWHMAWWGFLYHVNAHRHRHHYPHGHALYHRGLGAVELWPQVRSLLRKALYALLDWPASARLFRHDRQKYFFVPLQVASDSQVYRYSRYGTRNSREGRIEAFISDVMESFARHAPAKTKLVFKHHPMDRGYRHYGAFIRRTARRLGIADRVIYLIKNVPTPWLIDHSLGVIVINSTVGLQGVLHGRPVKVLGQAIYDMPGLTAQCSLDAFWKGANDHVPDAALVERYVHHLKKSCLIRGSFFRRISESPLHCGLEWPEGGLPVPVQETDVSDASPAHGQRDSDGLAVPEVSNPRKGENVCQGA